MKADIGLFQKETQSGKVENSLSRIISGVLVAAGLGLAFAAVLTEGAMTNPEVTLVLGIIGIGVTGKVISGGLEK